MLREEVLRVVDGGDGPVTPTVSQLDMGEGRIADLVSDPTSCGTGGCGVSLYATYDGCYRELGDFFGGGISPWGTSPSGWPFIVSTTHCDAGNFTVMFHQLVDGRYAEVDRCHVCLFEGTTTDARPPFRAACDYDEPCQLLLISPREPG